MRRSNLFLLMMMIVLVGCGAPRPPAEPGDRRWAVWLNAPSVPVAADDLVLVAAERGACADPATAAGECPARIVALDRETGAQRWVFAHPQANRRADLQVAGGMLFVMLHDTTHTLVVLDAATGQQRWQSDTLAELVRPAVTAGLVVMARQNSDGSTPLITLDRQTGANVANAITGDLQVVAADGDRAYALMRDGRLLALDGVTGSIVWSVATRFGEGFFDPSHQTIRLDVQPEGLVVQARPAILLVSEVEVFDLQDGARRWTAPLQLPDAEPAPAANGLIYLRDITSTELRAYDLRDGSVRWVRAVGRTPINPLLANGRIYIGTSDKGVWALDALSGDVVWGPRKIDLPLVAHRGVLYGTRATAGLGEISISSAAYATDEASGQRRWVAEGASNVYTSAPILTGDQVYLRSSQMLYALK